MFIAVLFVIAKRCKKKCSQVGELNRKLFIVNPCSGVLFAYEREQDY